ncbi:hypothetical protein SteCoe_38223 [Stentor coeruleus]|uniref:Calcium uniporter protein C-terminal domain-containing protein n=1 Tax=Stentor coeruleus TaxID=5963 RepID=A0A1R2ALP0_9CILI|nr:hypothetical protein SteCoe_38223 [Stentor coeruleus]
MFSRLVRRVHVIELTSNIPPKMILDLGNSPKEYILNSKDTISQLFEQIKNNESSIKDLKILVNHNQVPENTLLGDIMNQQFILTYGKKHYHILPSRNFYINGNESYHAKCQERGVPINEARKIARYLFVLEKQLPDNFDSETFSKAVASAKSMSVSFMQEEEEILKSQLESYKENLAKAISELNVYQEKADKYAEKILKIGLGVLLTQWSVIAYGTFVKYGWDVMEPFSYMVGSTWGILGLAFYIKHKEEFYPTSFREILYNQKLEKLMKKNHFSKDLINLLKVKIELVEKQLRDIQ